MDKDCVEGKCTCGAATEGKWADIHTKGCPALGEYSEPLAMIDAAWERHMAASTPDWPPQVSAVALPDGERRHGSTGQLFEAQSGQWVRVNPTRKQITRALEVQDALDDIDDKWFEEYGDIDP